MAATPTKPSTAAPFTFWAGRTLALALAHAAGDPLRLCLPPAAVLLVKVQLAAALQTPFQLLTVQAAGKVPVHHAGCAVALPCPISPVRHRRSPFLPYGPTLLPGQYPVRSAHRSLALRERGFS